jgi:hypothetical protein
MIGSLMSRMADAEKLSIPQLNQAVKNGTIPAYVGVPLIQEKMKAEQAAKAMVAQTQAQPPLARQVMEQADMMSGLEKLQSNLPEEGYAGGGIIAFADGGVSTPDDDEDEEKNLMSRLMAGITSLKQGVTDRIPSSDAIKQSIVSKMPSGMRSAVYDGPQKGDYVAPPAERRARGGHKYENMVAAEAERIGLDPNIAVHALYKETGNLKNPESARSRAGAIGVMQLMPRTAKELGVDPLIPEENIRGGVMYLKQMYDKYQDPTLALAAYNAGPGRVDRALKSGQGIASLPRETQNYVIARNMAEGGIVAFSNGGVNRPFTTDSKGITRVPQYPLAIYEKPETKRVMAGLDANVYPGASDLNYYNELAAQLEKDPTYEPYKEEMEKLLKRNPTLLTATQPATNITGPLANVGNKKEKVEPKPAEDKPQFNFPPQGGIGPTDAELGRNAPADVAPAPYKEPAADQGLSDIKSLLKQRMEESGKQKRIDAYMSLLQAGLGMMGGSSPFASVNIGQGAAQGVAAQMAARKSQVADENAILTGQLGLSRAELYEKMRRDALKQQAEKTAAELGLRKSEQGIRQQAQNIKLGDLRRKASEDWDNSPRKAQLEAELAKQKKNWRQDTKLLGQYEMMRNRFINEFVNVGQADNILSSSQY